MISPPEAIPVSRTRELGHGSPIMEVFKAWLSAHFGETLGHISERVMKLS